MLKKDLMAFLELVRKQKRDEDLKPRSYGKIAGRIQLFREILRAGIHALIARCKTMDGDGDLERTV